MKSETRERFDRELERVLRRLPAEVRKLLEEIPLVVEDYPSRRIMRTTGTEDPSELCGLFDGEPYSGTYTDAGWERPVGRSPVIYLYRRGLLEQARSPIGRRIVPDLLRREIRTTILHEVGHYWGMDEDELEEYGYG
ncbi:MAG: metallopeptidase family protein [Planctomycetia bacterium]|nr:metallopeptidase family protein [Planctomycetia bacterium]